MNNFEYILPSNVNEERFELEAPVQQGYLEIEIGKINYNATPIIPHIHKLNSINSNIYKHNCKNNSKVLFKQQQQIPTQKQRYQQTQQQQQQRPHCLNINNKKFKESLFSGKRSVVVDVDANERKVVEAIVKFVWLVETRDAVASVRISCYDKIGNKCLSSGNIISDIGLVTAKEKNLQLNKRKRKRNSQKQLPSAQLSHQLELQLQLISTSFSSSIFSHNKLRYKICSNLKLFLEYLRSCAPIQLSVCTNSLTHKSLGQARLPLPVALLRKYATTNYVNANELIYKTKIYALYKQQQEGSRRQGRTNSNSNSKVEGNKNCATDSEWRWCQDHPKTVSANKHKHQLQLKTAEIQQFHFEMLFAPTSAKRQRSQMTPQSPKVQIPAKPGITKLLTNGFCLYENCNQQYAHQKPHSEQETKEDSQKAEITTATIMPTTSEQIAEAMKKLDAKLVAYLAGEEHRTSAVKSSLAGMSSSTAATATTTAALLDDNDNVNVEIIDDDDDGIPGLIAESNVFKHLNSKLNMTMNNGYQLDGNMMTAAERYHQRQLQLFGSVDSINLQMEALTLEAEGTRRMEILQNDVRPIFTVECQLSQELLHEVPRTDMFHIMQFESEKFQCLTQCTRFGQTAERKVRLNISDHTDPIEQLVKKHDNDEEMKNKLNLPNLGRIHFTVWWREPGTCLNEMLGMGLLQLNEFYNANLLEQCKRIMIKRRNVHLANIHLKINLQVPAINKRELQLQLQQQKQKQKQQEQEEIMNGNEVVANNGNAIANVVAQTAAAANKTAEYPLENNNFISNRSSNFMEETTTIRLLSGLICVDQLELQLPAVEQQKKSIFLVCRNFWKDAASIALWNTEQQQFDLLEEFHVLNDGIFRKRMEKQYLNLEVWLGNAPQQQGLFGPVAESAADNNGNASGTSQMPPTIAIDDWVTDYLGVAQLPLHQFFIAYRDIEMTNHLCKAPLPVISKEHWTPLIRCESGAKIGQLKCLLAIGTEAQIELLKSKRQLEIASGPYMKPFYTFSKCALVAHNAVGSAAATSATQKGITEDCLATATTATPKPTTTNTSATILNANNKPMKCIDELLLNLTQELCAGTTEEESYAGAIGGGIDAHAAHILKPHLPSNLKTFKFFLDIQRATGLPLNPSVKTKKLYSKRNAMASKRFPPDEPPTTYVTFQAQESFCKMYKSHEGPVYATKVIEKSLTPRWQGRFRVSVTTDYLTNPQKRFILKIWKKAATDLAGRRLEPTPLDDAIIGFAALDLTVFRKGLQIGGWLKIVDFNGRLNGQIEVRAQPLDDVVNILHQMQLTQATQTIAAATVGASSTAGAGVASTTAIAGTAGAALPMPTANEQFKQIEQTLDITHLNLGDAIKRKTIELQSIADHLRERLGEVTGSSSASSADDGFDLNELDNWQSFDELLEHTQDADIAQFELDLNTPPLTSPAVAVNTAGVASTSTQDLEMPTNNFQTTTTTMISMNEQAEIEMKPNSSNAASDGCTQKE